MPHFMETEIAQSDYVLIICTEEYKRKADERKKGVGYESHIISAELYHKHNERKFIPVLRQGSFPDAIPLYLDGKLAINLRDANSYEDEFKKLLMTFYRVKYKPKLGKRPSYIAETQQTITEPKALNNQYANNQIRI